MRKIDDGDHDVVAPIVYSLVQKHGHKMVDEAISKDQGDKGCFVKDHQPDYTVMLHCLS